MSSQKQSWTDRRYAWSYALFINLGIILYSVILYLFDIYQSAGFRAMYLLFILVGFVLLIKKYSDHHPTAKYLDAFRLCAKTGFYFLAILLPIVILFVLLNPDDVQLIQVMGPHTPSNRVQQIVGTLFFEMVPAIILSAICASFLTGWNKNNAH